eukprot:TRINITY_DN71423_c0_g1_i1.p1 TRINITY_DN71423_c0_g1~~TRINITY_DN71423_c0_g1_i1.p1  ORF type:complete len:192 (-),score=20.99 TRINITY_DN71423_c0_g1_i1:34-609(-)
MVDETLSSGEEDLFPNDEKPWHAAFDIMSVSTTASGQSSETVAEQCSMCILPARSSYRLISALALDPARTSLPPAAKRASCSKPVDEVLLEPFVRPRVRPRVRKERCNKGQREILLAARWRPELFLNGLFRLLDQEDAGNVEERELGSTPGALIEGLNGFVVWPSKVPRASISPSRKSQASMPVRTCRISL